MKAIKVVGCPLCSNPLRSYLGNLVKCVRGHRFYVQWGNTTLRKLVPAVTPGENNGYKAGDEFPVTDEEEFET